MTRLPSQEEDVYEASLRALVHLADDETAYEWAQAIRLAYGSDVVDSMLAKVTAPRDRAEPHVDAVAEYRERLDECAAEILAATDEFRERTGLAVAGLDLGWEEFDSNDGSSVITGVSITPRVGL